MTSKRRVRMGDSLEQLLEDRVVEVPKELSASTLQEILDAVKDARAQERKEESAREELQRELDFVRDALEQEIDPESYSSAEYDVAVSYGGKTFPAYYSGVPEATAAEKGAQVVVDASEEEHAFLDEAQKIQHDAREAYLANKFDASSFLDGERKAVKEEIKMRSIATWQLMYNGKIEFF